MRDAVLEGPSSAEIIALARLAEDASVAPPPHLVQQLRDKGWVMTTDDGHHLITLTGRALLERAETSAARAR